MCVPSYAKPVFTDPGRSEKHSGPSVSTKSDVILDMLFECSQQILSRAASNVSRPFEVREDRADAHSVENQKFKPRNALCHMASGLDAQTTYKSPHCTVKSHSGFGHALIRAKECWRYM